MTPKQQKKRDKTRPADDQTICLADGRQARFHRASEKAMAPLVEEVENRLRKTMVRGWREQTTIIEVPSGDSTVFLVCYMGDLEYVVSRVSQKGLLGIVTEILLVFVAHNDRVYPRSSRNGRTIMRAALNNLNPNIYTLLEESEAKNTSRELP